MRLSSSFPHRAPLTLAICTALLLCTATSWAVKAHLWQENTYAAFAAGTTEGVSIAADGTLRLAPSLDDFAVLDAQRVWSLLAAADGSLYVGSGDEGKIFIVDADGVATLLFDAPELAIHSLALDDDGMLYAGTAPDGLVYRIDPHGEATTYARTNAHYVWDLVFDADGRLLAATGEPGTVLALEDKDKSTTLYKAPDHHVMDLLVSAAKVYAATAQAGRVYQLTEPGRARLLYESDREEIHALHADADGILYASGLRRNDDEDKKKGSALYRIDPTGATQTLWTHDDGLNLAMSALGEDLLIATADPSRLYRLDKRGRATLVDQFDDFNPSRLLHQAAAATYVAAAQAGTLRRLSADYRAQGQFDSQVHDFRIQAHWGAIDWRAEAPKDTEIHLLTRSGNSEKPDETWSPWSVPLRQPGATISSPPARYLQYRALLKTSDKQETPALREVTLAGRQTNVPPRIVDFDTLPYRIRQSGKGGEQGGNTPVVKGNGNRRGGPSRPKSLRLVRWQAQDDNEDELHYTLYVRSVDQKEWKLGQENLSKTSVLWDTETMPEGLTLLKLVASDHPDNPDGEALTDEHITAPFAIDNSPPHIELVAHQSNPLHLEVKIVDPITPLHKAQYSIDYGDRLHQIVAQDGIFDSRQESARIDLPDLPAGEHVIAVQAWDQLDNVGTQQIIVQVK
jgi:sugar lactone lactonase YvrE